MKKGIFVLVLILAACMASSAQQEASAPEAKSANGASIEWKEWEAAVAANEADPRKILVDVYTDWCGWCKVMDRKTFTDPDIVEYINENFHAIKLDAESKETINWQGYEFKWMEGGRNGVHALAYSLLNKQMSFPQFVLLDQEFKRIRIVKGFKDAKSFMPELEYAASEEYKSSPVDSQKKEKEKDTKAGRSE